MLESRKEAKPTKRERKERVRGLTQGSENAILE